MIVAFEVSYYACGCAECVSVVGIVVWAVDNWASIILSHFSYLKSLWYLLQSRPTNQVRCWLVFLVCDLVRLGCRILVDVLVDTFFGCGEEYYWTMWWFVSWLLMS